MKERLAEAKFETEEEEMETKLDERFDEYDNPEILGQSERWFMIRSDWNEMDMFDSDLQRDVDLAKNTKPVYPDGKSQKVFVLPGMRHGDGDPETVREYYSKKFDGAYQKTEKRSFITVGQGKMWMMPLSENPMMRTSMSTCSTVIGKSETHLFVAHISLSELPQVEGVVDFFKKNGVAIESAVVVASVGEGQEQRQELSHPRLATNIDAYTELGFNEENIRTFDYGTTDKPDDLSRFHFDKEDEDEEKNNIAGIENNITQVMVDQTGVYKYSFDNCKVKNRAVGHGVTFSRRSDYKNEEVIDF